MLLGTSDPGAFRAVFKTKNADGSSSSLNFVPFSAYCQIDFALVIQVKYLSPVAGVVELADTHGSGPCARKGVKVQVLSPAPYVFIETPQHDSCCGVFFYVGDCTCRAYRDGTRGFPLASEKCVSIRPVGLPDVRRDERLL